MKKHISLNSMFRRKHMVNLSIIACCLAFVVCAVLLIHDFFSGSGLSRSSELYYYHLIIAGLGVLLLLPLATLVSWPSEKLSEFSAQDLVTKLLPDKEESDTKGVSGNVVKDLTHDLNNLLVGVIGYAELVRKKLSGDMKLAEYTDAIVDSCTRASELAEKISAFSRYKAPRMELLDVHDVIKEVVGLVSRVVDKRIEVGFNLIDSPGMIKGDFAKLQNAFYDLATNARDAMPEGGELTFSSTIVDLDETFCAEHGHEIKAGKYLEVCVSDSGIGMGEEIMSRIFEPFFSTKYNEENPGLGLTHVYDTIQQHKGMITIMSEKERGSLFKLYLPLEFTPASDELPSSKSGIIHGRGYILLADDEDLIRLLGKELLEGMGYEVILAADGEEALSIYTEQYDLIDLVVLDMVMPKMHGREVFKRMKEINPDVRAMIISGFSLGIDAQGLINEGIRGFIQKPFRAVALSRKVAGCLDLPLTKTDEQRASHLM